MGHYLQKRIQHISPLLVLLFVWFAMPSLADAAQQSNQTTISGTVVDSRDGSTLAGVNVTVQGRVVGTATDSRGNFTLRVNQPPPFTLVISMVGFNSREIQITESNVEGLRIEISEQTISGSDVVVSASRIEETLLEAPVSIETMDIIDIQQTAAPSFYQAIGNLKGVDFSTQSLTFNS
ncbi:MAG: carboxypeptidase-like regulatory domain-containing protein, partial [Balneolaceae bacterium]